MTEPSQLGNWRDARDAHALCNKMGALCTGHSIGVVAAAVSGLLSVLPLEVQAQIAAAVAERINAESIADVPLPKETETTIEKIVKGLT